MTISTLAINEWGDLYLADGSNLVLLSGDVACAQDVGQATKMVRGENPFSTNDGVDYFGVVFSPTPDYDQFRYQITRAALTVPDTIDVSSLDISISGGQLDYVMDVTTIYGSARTEQSIKL